VAGAQSIRNDEKCIEQKNASARSALSRTSPRSIDYLPFGLCHNVSPLGESPCGSESHHQHPRFPHWLGMADRRCFPYL